MTQTRWWAGAATLGWGLMFGNEGKVWREVTSFGSQDACEHERQSRAREVRDKSATQPPLERVLAYYRCVERAD